MALDGVDRQREGNVALELCRAPLQHEQPASVGAHAELGEQPRLADPRLAADGDDGGRAATTVGEHPIEKLQLARAADEPDRPGGGYGSGRGRCGDGSRARPGAASLGVRPARGRPSRSRPSGAARA
jgi:hypothetical protein